MAVTRKPRVAITPEKIKIALEKAKALVLTLEKKAYASTIDEHIKKSNIVSMFEAIKANASGASDVVVLAAIGKAVGISRLVISQSVPAPRKKKLSDTK